MSRSVTYKLAVTKDDYSLSGELETEDEWLARATAKTLRDAGCMVGLFITTAYVGVQIIHTDEPI